MNNFVSQFTTIEALSFKHIFISEASPTLQHLGTSFLISPHQAFFAQLTHLSLNPAIDPTPSYLSAILKELASPKGQYSFIEGQLQIKTILDQGQGRILLLSVQYETCKDSPRDMMMGLFQHIFKSAQEQKRCMAQRRNYLLTTQRWLQGLGKPNKLQKATQKSRMLLNKVKQHFNPL